MITKTITNTRVVTEFTIDEVKQALNVANVLAIYMVDGKVEVVVSSE